MFFGTNQQLLNASCYRFTWKAAAYLCNWTQIANEWVILSVGIILNISCLFSPSVHWTNRRDAQTGGWHQTKGPDICFPTEPAGRGAYNQYVPTQRETNPHPPPSSWAYCKPVVTKHSSLIQSWQCNFVFLIKFHDGAVASGMIIYIDFHHVLLVEQQGNTG